MSKKSKEPNFAAIVKFDRVVWNLEQKAIRDAMPKKKISKPVPLSKERLEQRRIQSAGIKRLHAARRTQARPQWADLDAINDLYRRAKMLTESTGIPHEVDHIEPLLGKDVSGLHVEYNMRVITRTENRRKSNRR
jgi:hypothetical protein